MCLCLCLVDVDAEAETVTVTVTLGWFSFAPIQKTQLSFAHIN